MDVSEVVAVSEDCDFFSISVFVTNSLLTFFPSCCLFGSCFLWSDEIYGGQNQHLGSEFRVKVLSGDVDRHLTPPESILNGNVLPDLILSPVGYSHIV